MPDYLGRSSGGSEDLKNVKDIESQLREIEIETLGNRGPVITFDQRIAIAAVRATILLVATQQRNIIKSISTADLEAELRERRLTTKPPLEPHATNDLLESMGLPARHQQQSYVGNNEVSK